MLELVVETRRESLQTLIKPDLIPQLPGSAMRVLKVAQDVNAPASLITNAISIDPVFSARILRAVNSPLYSFQREVKSLSQAVNMLGTKAIMQLVMAYAASDTLSSKGNHAYLEQTLWRHSVAVGIAAKEVAVSIGKKDLAELAFLCGLLHDIGILWLLRYDPGISDILLSMPEHTIIDYERDCYGGSHEEMGAIITKRWGLPKEITNVINYHHRPNESRESYLLTLIINAADSICNLRGMGYCDSSMNLLGFDTLNTLEITEEQQEDIWDNVESKFDEMISMLTTVV
jgi:putative nucleotidyltransferase with HDIG domain